MPDMLENQRDEMLERAATFEATTRGCRAVKAGWLGVFATGFGASPDNIPRYRQSYGAHKRVRNMSATK